MTSKREILKVLRKEMEVKRLTYIDTFGEKVIQALPDRKRNIEIDRKIGRIFGRRVVFACYNNEIGPYFTVE